MGIVSTVVCTTCSPPPAEGGASEDPHQQQRWSSFDSSVNAVSFGFVATAILVSMFLVMAIFERFLRPTPTSSSSSSSAAPHRLRRQPDDVESGPPPKLGFPSPKMTVYTKGVSVLMPGEELPTFIAHPAPIPCPPECIRWTPHQQNQYWNPSRISPNLHQPS